MKYIRLLVLLVSLLFIAGCEINEDALVDAKIMEITTWVHELLPEVTSDNITLPVTHPTLGGEITWQSSDITLLTNEGQISSSFVNEEVMLEYTIRLDNLTESGNKTILVVGISLDSVSTMFESQFSTMITRDYHVQTTYYDLFHIDWSSSKEDIFSNEGKYRAPFYNDKTTINYTVTLIPTGESKIFEKEVQVRGMYLNDRISYIKHYLENYFSNTNILKQSTILPQTIDGLDIELSWKDSNETNLITLSDVTSHVIPNVGVDLTVNVKALDQEFTIVVTYQIEEVNQTATLRVLPSIDLIKEMRVGWNLGNTFDAPNEIAWGNPKTTKKMIDAVKDAGFNVIRIPVTWEGHFDDEYIIQKDWLNRVQEVVNYAIDNETFVILNMHHEKWNSTSYANKERASAMMQELWTQIGTRFGNYNEYLIFEGMNEPRIYEASDSIQWGGSIESFEVVNHLNQVFVDTIRSLGGNNSYRHLMITTNGAGTSEANISSLEVPNDPYIIVSLHAYTPYNFAHDKTTITTWNKDNPLDTNPIDAVFDRIKRYFTDNNIAVIMGEFSSRDKENISARLEWLEYYLDQANIIGIPCIWWDTGQVKTTENMTFSIFDRKAINWLFPEIVEMLMDKTTKE